MDNIRKNLQNSITLEQSLLKDASFFESFELMVSLMLETFTSGNKIISCGNGGSMSDAMHFAEELTGRYHKNRISLPAIAISDPAHISCVANDFGYDQIFSRFVEAHGNEGDLLLGISTSGNSQNVINAFNVAKLNKVKTIALLGKDGGEMKNLADVHCIVKSNDTARIQEKHIFIIHNLIQEIEIRGKFTN